MNIVSPVVQVSHGASFSPDSDPRQVVKWCKTAAQMTGGQRSKAFKLCDYKSVRYAGNNSFICLPLDTNTVIEFDGVVYEKLPFPKDYNREPTPYLLLKNGTDWVCTCQWSAKMGRVCAHILALKIEFKRGSFK